METWKSVLVCTVYVHLLINFVSGLVIPRCIHGWLDIPDESITVIKCNDISGTDTVRWTLENEDENRTIFDGFCGITTGICRSKNNDMYLERHSVSETSLNIAKNHWSYGGLRLTCSTKTEVASCITNVIHSAELSNCRTEITLESWQLTVTCNVDNFFSSNKLGRCGGIQREERKTQPSQSFKTVSCPLVLHNCTNQTNLQIYQKGNCSCTLDLPDVIGNYSYIMKLLPGEAQEIAGEVRIGVRVASKQDQVCGRLNTEMETWRFILQCLVYLNLPVNLVSAGPAMSQCIQGWLDIPDEGFTVIKCNNISGTDTVRWTLENEAENQTIFDGFCGITIGICRSHNNDIYSERRNASETSLNIAKNHWSYGGLRLTCSTKTENASCITNVIHSAELSSCRTEVTQASWQLTVTCNVDNFFSSNKPGRCGVIPREEGKREPSQNLKTVSCRPVLDNCTNQTNLQIYQKGNCSCTLDLPDVIGNYSYIMKVLPDAMQEIPGEVRIDNSETNCTIFMKKNPRGSCKCYQRDPGSFSTTPDTGENSTYVCILVRASTSQTGGPTNNTCQNPHPPTSPPIIKGNENILIVGENKTLTCTVRGGNPLVSSVIFICGNKTTTHDFGDDESVSSSVTFLVQVHHHNTSCVCSAIWQRKPELFQDKAFIRLYVKDMATTEGKTEDKTEFLAQTTFVSQETKPQDQESTHTFQSMSSSLDKREHGQSVNVSVIVPVIVAIIVVIAGIVAAVVYVHRKKQNRTEAQVARSNEVEKPKDEFDEQVNMVYVSADMLGIARNSVIIGLRQSRGNDSSCRPSPDESSEVTQRRSTPEGETQTALKEDDRKRESTTSENFYAVVDDNDLAETNP